MFLITGLSQSTLVPSSFKRAFAVRAPATDEEGGHIVSENMTPANMASDRPRETGESLLSLRGITKTFPGVVANNNISLEIRGGEVHAILGENGAGKSTLMKIIYGFYQPDSGSVYVNGRPASIQSPNDSRRLGIGMVFQNFTLVPAMTVIENVALFLPKQGIFLNKGPLLKRILEVSDKYDLHVNPKARVGDLTMGERQKVELLKLILAQAQVLIFDEPTSVLAPHEVDGLFRVFSELRRDGYAVLFITHKIREVVTSADYVTVLRHGEVVNTLPIEDVDAGSLVSMMLGVETPEAVRNPAMSQAKAQDTAYQNITSQNTTGQNTAEGAALEFRDVWTGQSGDSKGLHGAGFHVMPGEILGVAGVSGNGQEELGEVLLGLRRKRRGSVFLSGEDVGPWPVSRILDAGVGYIPEDALGMAVVPDMQVEENMVLGELHNYGSGGVWLDWGSIRSRMKRALADFPLTLARPDARVEQLSGGNIQRVVLARELVRSPKTLLAYYPTRGLDVLTAEATRRLLMDCRERGGAVVLVSEDLDELFALSDRLVVMYQGEVVGEFNPKDASVHDIGLLMTGHRGPEISGVDKEDVGLPMPSLHPLTGLEGRGLS